MMFKTPENKSEPNLSTTVPETPKNIGGFGRSKRFREESGEASYKNDFTSLKQEMSQMFLNMQAENTKDIKSFFTTWKSESDSRLIKIESSLAKIEKSYSEIEKALEFSSKQYDDMQAKTSRLENECKDQRAIIVQLEDKLEEMQRISKINYIEIRNVPKKDGETKQDIDNYITNMCKSIKVTVPAAGIKDCFRMPGKKTSNPTILTELQNNSMKTQILRAVKDFNKANQNNKLNSMHLGTTAPFCPIYVAEHLTPHARRLHFVARTFVKTKHLHSCWISNGKVFVKKFDNSNPLQVKSEYQLENISVASA